MTHPRVLRHRGAVKASLAVLAVLLIGQAAIPISQRQNESSGSGRLGEDGGRRLGWFGGWGGGAKEAEVEPNQEDRGPAGGGEPLVDVKGDETTQRVEEKTLKLKPIPDVQGAGGGLGGLKAHPRMHPIGAKLPNVPISETVDLEVPREGLLWQPTTMSPLKCGEAADASADECEATITFCLMRMAEYQETPWKYPMAVMLQKKSECSKAENLRSFRLSDLRTYMREHPEEFLQPNGFVYHETRTGSTLVANMLAHVPSNLVVSENNMAEDPVRRCSDCTEMQKVALLREIMTLLGNGRNGHEHLFFKFQDSTTLPLMMKAYPEVGWVYLFRDPVEVMVSNLKGAYGKRERFYKGFDFDAAEHDMNNNNNNNNMTGGSERAGGGLVVADDRKVLSNEAVGGGKVVLVRCDG
ncbi:unnamed protein product [Ectocarpus sp. CCAP 1310/34]|nr:unnamed protein product [Ectocarpus sp. CCAP 1310/34]